MSKELKVLDLFCGCGGLSTGFIEAGFTVSHGIDIWKDAVNTFRINHPKSEGLVADLSSIDIKDYIKKNKIKIRLIQ